jgi:hypothetical protein
LFAIRSTKHWAIFRFALSTADLEQWRQTSQSYDRFAAVSIGSAEWAGVNEPERVATADVSQDFFPALGISPTAGRWFAPDDFRPDADPSAVVSEGFWRSRLGGRPDTNA